MRSWIVTFAIVLLIITLIGALGGSLSTKERFYEDDETDEYFEEKDITSVYPEGAPNLGPQFPHGGSEPNPTSAPGSVTGGSVIGSSSPSVPVYDPYSSSSQPAQPVQPSVQPTASVEPVQPLAPQTPASPPTIIDVAPAMPSISAPPAMSSAVAGEPAATPTAPSVSTFMDGMNIEPFEDETDITYGPF